MVSAALKIGTHNGSFHCDEVLACFMLKQLPKYANSTIVRSRDPVKLDECDIVVDVGGVYDLAKNRFDHHQRTFSETYSSINPAKSWKIKLSSAGLIYVHFGREIITEILKKFSPDSVVDEKLVDILENKMYEQFVREIDAIDNGVEIAEDRKYEINTNLSSRVGHLNPSWNDKEADEEKQFEKALDMVGSEFEQRIKYYALVWWPARSIVVNAINDRFKIDDSGAILSIDGFCPWKSHLFQLETELKLTNNELKYVIYNDTAGAYRVQCVPLSESSFTNRLSLPQEWCGLRDDELTKKSEIEGGIFVHMNGFIGGNKTYEGALAMLQKSLKMAESAKKQKVSE